MIGIMQKVVTLAGVAAIMSGSAHPIAASRAAPRSIAATPITATEIERGISPGLGCSFQAGKDVLFLVVIGEALAKPNGVLTHFKIDSEHSLSVINFGGAVGNREWRVLIDRDDKPVSYAEEATTRKARLTFRRAGAEKTVTGLWTCGA